MKMKYTQPRTLQVNYRFPIQFDERLTDFAKRTGTTKTKVLVNATQHYLSILEEALHEKKAGERGKASGQKATALCP